MKCSKCGAELSEGTKYCSYCGAKIETNDDQTANDQTREETEEALEKETENSSCSHENNIKMEIPKMHHQETEKNLSNRAKEKGANIWKNLSLFGKVSTVLIAIFVILCIISFVAGNVLGIAISALQIIIVVLAIMIHKEVIKVPQGWIKFLLLGIALLLTFVNIFNFTKGKEKTMAVTGADGPEEISIETSESAPYKLEKGTEFAYGTDEWNVYIATAISDSMIKIENWNKSSSSSKKVKKEYEVGTFKINDTENGFSWTDKDHLSFSFNLKDKDCSAFKKSQSIIFTININEGDVYKGTDYNEDIASYKFECDDWHMYRAIPLNENVLKIECWSRGSSSGRFIYGYDVCLINQKKTKSDFAWTDDERTSFTITMKDPDNNYYWKKANFVTFEKEEGSKVADVKTFLGKQTAAEDEAKVPKTAADYTHENYKDVMKEFQDAGFTDIKENVLYDIVFGITDEGEVDSVSVDGKEDFIKGEVFKKNAPIVITYHMKEEKDPSKVHTPYNSSELPEIN